MPTTPPERLPALESHQYRDVAESFGSDAGCRVLGVDAGRCRTRR